MRRVGLLGEMAARIEYFEYRRHISDLWWIRVYEEVAWHSWRKVGIEIPTDESKGRFHPHPHPLCDYFIIHHNKAPYCTLGNSGITPKTPHLLTPLHTAAIQLLGRR